MATPITQSRTIPAQIESGRILDVDISTYTVSVTTEFTKKPVTGVKFATPYQHYANGEGIYFMPEVGSLCWICFPSDHNRPFVIAWGPATVDGDARSKKKDLNPGDIYLGTRDENFLILRRGGVVQIGGGPLSQRMFLPVNNTIKDFCENYSLHSIAGDLEWSVAREESTTTGDRPSLLSIRAREFANDPSPIAQLLIGSHGDGDNRILSILIKDSGKNNAAKKIELSFGKDGIVKWDVTSDVEWNIDGELKITVSKDIAIKTNEDFSVTSDKTFISSSGGIDIKASGATVNIDAPLVTIGSIAQINGQVPVAMAPALIVYLATHFHNIIIPTPGSPTSPPAIPPPASIASQTCFAK